MGVPEGWEAVYVTGATEFIGAHCNRLFLHKNYKPGVYSRMIEKYLVAGSSVPVNKGPPT